MAQSLPTGFVETDDEQSSGGGNALALVSTQLQLVADMQRERREIAEDRRQLLRENRTLFVENVQYQAGILNTAFEDMMAPLVHLAPTDSMTGLLIKTTLTAGSVTVAKETNETFDPVGRMREAAALAKAEAEVIRAKAELARTQGVGASVGRLMASTLHGTKY